MSDNVTRDELRLHIDLIEQKAETRQAVTDGKLERIADAVDVLTKTLTSQMADLKSDVAEVKSDNKNTRWAIAGIVLASALAVVGIVVTTQGTMTTANGNVLAAFGAGKEAGAPAPVPAPPLYDPQTGKKLAQ